MTTFEWINDNLELVEKLNKAGIVKYKAPLYYAIYSRYKYYFDLGNIKTRAIVQACTDFNTCKKTGFLVIQEMEKEI